MPLHVSPGLPSSAETFAGELQIIIIDSVRFYKGASLLPPSFFLIQSQYSLIAKKG